MEVATRIHVSANIPISSHAWLLAVAVKKCLNKLVVTVSNY